MTTLDNFNHLPAPEASALLAPCVALPGWVTAMVAARPYASTCHLLAQGAALAGRGGEAELEQALCAHPRIGEKPVPQDTHGALSRQEQSAVNSADHSLADALRSGNARYEARFGRVFLIRAAGRSGPEILAELARRLSNTPDDELRESLSQLRDITLLRLEGAIHP